MFQLTYVSAARVGLMWTDVDAIVVTSRRNNHCNHITGLLVHDGARFLQVIEGERETVELLYARIRADPRHVDPMVIAARAVAERAFSAWDLACQEVITIDDSRSFARTVEDRVSDVRDRTLRMLFSSFLAERPAGAAHAA